MKSYLNARPLTFLAGLLLLFLISGTQALDIYQSATSAVPCTRLLHGDGTIGCQSEKVSGPIFLLETQDQVDEFLSNDAYVEKYVFVMTAGLFTPGNLKNLRETGKLAGVVTLPTRPDRFSPETTCPNCDAGLYRKESNQHQWNPHGSGLTHQNFDFPIFGINETDASGVTEAGKLNRERGNIEFPLYGLELDAFMWAITDSTTCLRRITCDPIGGRSVWNVVKSLSSNDHTPLIALTASIDSTAFYRDAVIGRSSQTSGLIALLAVAESFATNPALTFSRNILFTFFDAEAWSFSGSRRFVQEVNSFECTDPIGDGCKEPYQYNLEFKKLKLNNIKAIIELGQVSGLESPEGGILYAHVDDADVSGDLVANLTTVADAVIPVASFLQPAYNESVNYKLPPSSAMAFLDIKRDIPTVVIGDFKSEYSNKYHYSTFDDQHNEEPSSRSAVTCQIAEVTAKTAYLLANPTLTINDTNSIVIDCDLVDTLYYCLTKNFSCPLVAKFFTSTVPTPTHYSSIFTFGKIGAISGFVHEYLAHLTAYDQAGECPCDTSEKPFTCVAGKCVLSRVQYHDAYSPGISWDYSLSQWKVTDASEFPWTESQWKYTTLTFFAMEGQAPQIGVLMAGILLTLLTLLATFMGNRHLKKTLKME